MVLSARRKVRLEMSPPIKFEIFLLNSQSLVFSTTISMPKYCGSAPRSDTVTMAINIQIRKTVSLKMILLLSMKKLSWALIMTNYKCLAL